MHQQRVLAHINQRKREAMTCYTQALTDVIPNVYNTTHLSEKTYQDKTNKLFLKCISDSSC